MARIIDSRAGVDQTVKIFDDFYGFDLVVNGDEFDVVNGYFQTICSTKQIAGNFTVYLFRISQQTGIPVMNLLDYIKGYEKLQVNNVIAYYLNSFKSKTSLYGFGVLPQPNLPVARNIVQ